MPCQFGKGKPELKTIGEFEKDSDQWETAGFLEEISGFSGLLGKRKVRFCLLEKKKLFVAKTETMGWEYQLEGPQSILIRLRKTNSKRVEATFHISDRNGHRLVLSTSQLHELIYWTKAFFTKIFDRRVSLPLEPLRPETEHPKIAGLGPRLQKRAQEYTRENAFHRLLLAKKRLFDNEEKGTVSTGVHTTPSLELPCMRDQTVAEVHVEPTVSFSTETDWRYRANTEPLPLREKEVPLAQRCSEPDMNKITQQNFFKFSDPEEPRSLLTEEREDPPTLPSSSRNSETSLDPDSSASYSTAPEQPSPIISDPKAESPPLTFQVPSTASDASTESTQYFTAQEQHSPLISCISEFKAESLVSQQPSTASYALTQELPLAESGYMSEPNGDRHNSTVSQFSSASVREVSNRPLSFPAEERVPEQDYRERYRQTLARMLELEGRREKPKKTSLIKKRLSNLWRKEAKAYFPASRFHP